jgi:hypothetical protein
LIAKTILNLFQVYQHRYLINKFNNQGTTCLHGFDWIQDSTGTYIYISDYSNDNIIIFNENWEYKKSSSNIIRPAFIKVINDEVFITADGGVYKTDKNVNIMLSYLSSGMKFRGIYYNVTSDLIYVDADNLKIFVFNRNLGLLSSLDTIGYNPYAIIGYNGKLVVGTTNGIILIVENGAVTTILVTVCSFISSLLIDDDGYMFVLCRYPNQLCAYHINGTYFGNVSTTFATDDLTFISFESKGHLIIISFSQINIYF